MLSKIIIRGTMVINESLILQNIDIVMLFAFCYLLQCFGAQPEQDIGGS